MIGKSFSNLMILGYVVVIIALLLAASPVGAIAGGSATSAVDAKLGNFEPISAADQLAYRWQAMGDWYAEHDMLNFGYAQAAENEALRWQAMGDWYAAHDMLNAAAVSSLPVEESKALQALV